MQIMIELKEVSFTYRSGSDQNGIKNMNLTIQSGEVIILTGSSGCGKTTVTRLINGLIPNFHDGDLKGEVLVNGRNVSTIPIYETARQVGSVFQNPRSQFFNVDTTSELAFALENQGLPAEVIRKRIQSTASNLRIDALLNRSIFMLSGGEKQKIACASVSVSNPEVIVLDEPSSNLDTAAIDELRKMIAFWKRKGKTIVIAEHRLYYLLGLADRMIIMEEGRIRDIFTAEQMFRLGREDTERLGIRPLLMEGLEYQDRAFPVSKGSIHLSEFAFTYKDGRHGIDLKEITVQEQSVIAVIGHNGAGKSTFARCLCGLEKNCRGQLTVGSDTYGNKQRLRFCYMVMQDVNHQLFTESVLDEVLLSLRETSSESEEKKQERAEQILESLGLLQWKDCHPLSLSGGQKQRVAIASAVASGRRFVLFDEPTSGLDHLHMKQVADHIRSLGELGKTVFVITHDPELILQSCSHVLHLENGSVKEFYQLNGNTEKRLKGFFLQIGKDTAFEGKTSKEDSKEGDNNECQLAI